MICLPPFRFHFLRLPGCLPSFLCLASLQAEEIGERWTWRNPFPQGNSFHDLAKADGQYFAGGRAGTIYSSPDGVTWSPRVSGTGEFLRRIVAAGSTVVAVGRGGTITSSLDGGLTWSARSSGSEADFSQLIHTGSRWVAIEGEFSPPDAVRCITSTDSVTWTPSTGLGSRLRIEGIAWSGARLVAVGTEWVERNGSGGFEQRVAHSEDGQEWTMVSEGLEDGVLEDIVWTGNQFIVTAQPGTSSSSLVTNSYTSPDGLTWTGHQQDSYYGLDCIVWTGARASASSTFYSTDVNGYRQFTSPDGITWVASNSPPRRSQIDHLAASGNDVIAVAGLGSISASDDHGQTWVDVSISSLTDNLNIAVRAEDGWIVAGAEGVLLTSNGNSEWTLRMGIGFTSVLRGMAVADGTWIATGRNPVGNNDGGPGVVLISKNGIDWQIVPSAPTSRLYSVIRAGSQWVVGGTGAVHTSPDGLAWSRRSLPGLREVRGVASNGTRIVAVGGDDSDDGAGFAAIYFSDDGGENWTFAKIVGAIMQAVTWTGSQFVAVGNNSQILTSPSGAEGAWTSRPAAGDGNLRAVASDESRIVIAGTDGIQTSTDNGVTWRFSAVPTEETLYAVIKAGTQWVACGYDGSLITSPDAIHWTLRETGTDHELFALASTPDGLWVAGEGGTILSSVPDPSDTDQDGLVDFLEVYFGTNPAVPNGSPVAIEVTSAAALMTWPEASATGQTVTPQWSPDLVTWLASGESTPGVAARTLTVTTPAAGRKRAELDTTGSGTAHLRLKVARP